MSTVLVTGGAGYIGTHILTVLAAAGHRCVVVDNYSNSSPVAIERVRALVPRDSVQAYEVDIRFAYRSGRTECVAMPVRNQSLVVEGLTLYQGLLDRMHCHKDETRIWIAKHYGDRADNLLCVAAMLETTLVIKTVMHHFSWGAGS
jgi:NAD(P)-dependent dehydrogenase (short-subunit alcohol dehydrogenase family)